MSKSPLSPETFKYENMRFLKVMLTNVFSKEKVVTVNFSCTINGHRRPSAAGPKMDIYLDIATFGDIPTFAQDHPII